MTLLIQKISVWYEMLTCIISSGFTAKVQIVLKWSGQVWCVIACFEAVDNVR